MYCFYSIENSKYKEDNCSFSLQSSTITSLVALNPTEVLTQLEIHTQYEINTLYAQAEISNKDELKYAVSPS